MAPGEPTRLEAKLQRLVQVMRLCRWPLWRVQQSTPLNPFYEDSQLTAKRKIPANRELQLLIRSPLGFVAGCALLQNVDEMTA